MFKELRDFLMRGNIVDLAVAVVIGVAFGAVITSLVENIITPLVSLIGVPDFSTWIIPIGNASFRVGAFLNSLISFVVIAAVIFFVVVKPMQRLAALRPSAPAAPAGPTEVQLLAEIRDELRKRPA
jgi:large conductance mechanosensitive channel